MITASRESQYLINSLKIQCRETQIQGVWHEIFDFRFLYESVSPGHLSIPLGLFRIFLKFAEIHVFTNECLSPVSTTLAINLCHGFSVIASVFITVEKLLLVTSTQAINLLLVTMTLVNNYRWCHWHWWLTGNNDTRGLYFLLNCRCEK